VDTSGFKAYTAWRDRYAPPVIRIRGSFIAAADQVTRYGRQLGAMDWQIRYGAAGGDDPHTALVQVGYFTVWDAFQRFMDQFEGSNREVLTRTFWQAYHS